jgi:hypothetical protein
MDPLTKIQQFSPVAVDGAKPLNAPSQSEPLKIAAHDFKALSSSSKFCTINEQTVQSRLKLGKQDWNTDKEKLDQLHKVTLEMKNADTPGSMTKFFKNTWMAIKDSSVGRFFTRNIVPKFTTTTISKTSAEAKVDSTSKKTTFEIKLEGKISELNEQGEWVQKDMDSDDSKIVVEYDRMRGSTLKQRFMARLRGEPAPPEPKQIALKAQEDMTRQAHLRNCGIGFKAESDYKTSHPGYLAMLKRPTNLKLSDFSVNELKSLGADDSVITNRDKIDRLKIDLNKIGITKSDKKQKKAELLNLETDKGTLDTLKIKALKSEVERIRAVDNLCGEDSFIGSQRDSFEQLEEALSNNESVDHILLTAGPDLAQMSLMVEVALKREGDYATNLETLRLGSQEGILPRCIISSPWFFSPDAATKLAQNIENLANLPTETLSDDQKKLVINLNDKEPAANLGLIQEEPDPKQSLMELAQGFKDLAANKKAMYRFQGLMFALAENNSDEFRVGLIDEIHAKMQGATGLNDSGDQRWKTALGGALLAGGAIQAARGKLKSAAVLALFGGAGVLAGGANKETKKVRARTAMMVDALLAGMNAGTIDHVVKANKIMAEIKADETAQEWVNKQIGQVPENGENVTGILGDSHKIATLEKIDTISNTFQNYKVNDLPRGKTREDLLSEIEGGIQQRIENLKTLQQTIQTKKTELGDLGADLKPLHKGVEVHKALELEKSDAPLKTEVADELRTANIENLRQATGLIGSLTILKGAFAKNGQVRTSIASIEEKLVNLLKKDAANLDAQQIKEISSEIDKLRAHISSDKNVEKLTFNHAQQIHAVVNALDENAGRIAGIKLAMNRMAQAFSKADETYLSGDDFTQDLKLLETEFKNSSERSLNNLSLFTETDTTAAAKQLLEPFLKEVDDAKKCWDEFKTFRDVVRSYPTRDMASMNQVLSALPDHKNAMLKAADGLKSFADKHAQHAGVENPTNFRDLALEEADNALLNSAASLLGVENNSSSAKSLALFAGPFAKNDPIFQSAKNYLDQAGDEKNEKFTELFNELPDFSTRATHSDGVEDSISDWKSQLDPKKALQIVKTLVPDSDKNSTALSHAVEVATAFDELPAPGPVERSVYLAHIDAQFAIACQNEAILKIYGEKALNVKNLISNHSSKLEQLKSHGHDVENLNLNSLLEKYTNNREGMDRSEMSQLAALAKSLASLKEDVALTTKALLEADMLTLLTNSKPELQNLEGTDQEVKDLRAADFSFKPIEQEKQYIALNEQIGKVEKQLKEERTNAVQDKERVDQARTDLKEAGVSNDAVDQIGGGGETDYLANQFAKAVDHWKSGYFRKCVDDYKKDNNQKLTEQNKIDFKNKKKEEKGLSKEMDGLVLKYLDTSKLEFNGEIADQDEIIKIEEQEFRNNQGHRIVNSLRQEYGGGNLVSRDNLRSQWSPKVQGYLEKLRFEERPYLEKNLSETISRMAKDPSFENRGKRVKDLLDKIDLQKASSSKVIETENIVQKANEDRSKILTEAQNAQVTLGIRSAVIKSCLIDKSIKPENLTTANKDEVKSMLTTWGWSEEAFPADQLIEKEIEAVRENKCVPKTWLNEAGELQHKRSHQISQLARVQEEMVLALKNLNQRIIDNPILENNIAEAADFSDENAMNSIAAETLKGMIKNPEVLELKSSFEIARESLNSLFDSYAPQFLGAQEQLKAKKSEILAKIQACEDNKASWHAISKAVSDSLDGSDGSKAFFDVAFNVQDTANRVASHHLLTSIAKRDFESLAATSLNQNYMKVDNAINGETKKIYDQALKVQNLKVVDLLSDRSDINFFMNGEKLRTWVESYAKFRGVDKKDEIDFATAIANMPASEFLASFEPEGNFINFLNANEKTEKVNIPDLQSAMLALRDTHSQISSELRGFDGSFDNGDRLSMKINGLSSGKIKNGNSTRSALVSFTKNFDPAKSKQKLQELFTESKKIAESSNLAPKEDLYNFKALSDKKFVELVKENRNPYRIPPLVNQPPQVNPSEQNMVEDDIEIVVEENGGPRLLSPIMMA